MFSKKFWNYNPKHGKVEKQLTKLLIIKNDFMNYYIATKII